MATDQWFPHISDAYQAFLLDAEARHLTQPTLQYYHARLGPFVAYCGDITLDRIGSSLIRQYLAAMAQRRLSGYSLLGAARAIRAFCNFCVREEWLVESPMRKLRMPQVEYKEPQVYTQGEIQAILAACLIPRDKAIVLFLLYTGVRAAEMVNLNVKDVHMETGTVQIRHGKGRKDRTVFVGVKGRKALLAYLMRRGRFDSVDPLWVSQREGRLTQNGLVQLLRRYSASVNIQNAEQVNIANQQVNAKG